MIHYLINQLHYETQDESSSGSFCCDSTVKLVLQTSPIFCFQVCYGNVAGCIRKAITALRNITSSGVGDSTREA